MKVTSEHQNINALQSEFQSEIKPTDKSLDINKAIAELAKEFLDNASMKEQNKKDRMAKIEKLIQYITEMVEFHGDEILYDQSKNLFRQLTRVQENIARHFQTLDLSVMANASISDLFEEYLKKTGELLAAENDIIAYSGLRPDNIITEQILDVISSIDKAYQVPHQQVAEILADMYNQFSELNTVVAAMISAGKVDPDTSNITIDISQLRTAVNNLVTSFNDQNSPINIKLQAISFSAADKGKADEIVAGTGLIVLGGPDIFFLGIDPKIGQNLQTAFNGIAGTANAASVSITTYQLQSFQTALDSQGNYLSSGLQAGSEKYRKTISMGDNFFRLVTSFIDANNQANRQFLT